MWVTWHRGSCRSSTIMPSFLRGSKFFFVGISWVQNVSSGYFVGLKLFYVSILWVQHFFSWVFCGFNFFAVANFVIQELQVVDCLRKSDKKQQYINTSQTAYSIANQFQQLPVLFILEKYIIY